MAINEKYSHQGSKYEGVDLTGVDPEEFNNTTVVNSSFYQEALWDKDSQGNTAKNPSRLVFPPAMTGVTFIRCNLDNVQLPGPPDAMIGDRTINRKIRVQNDNKDWVCDGTTNKPTEPVNLKDAQQKGHITEPANLPVDRLPPGQVG